MSRTADREFEERLIAAQVIIDSQPYAVMSNRTRPAVGTSWGIVHWKTAESLAVLYPGTYRITRRGHRIRNVRRHPEEA